MAQGTVMPSPWFTGFDDNGNPLVGGKLYTYAAGTTNAQATYSDVSLSVANANPVVLDSAGRATVYLLASSYKFVLKDSAGNTIRTQDNVSAVAPFAVNLDIDGAAGETITAGQVCYLSDGSGSKTAGRWYLADADADYASSLPMVALAPNDIASGASGSFRVQGRITVTGPLVAGTTYYVSATAGALASTAGTFSRVVGVADSTTTLVMAPNPASVTIAYDTSTNLLANQVFS
jgi:hypothetical protein